MADRWQMAVVVIIEAIVLVLVLFIGDRTQVYRQFIECMCVCVCVCVYLHTQNAKCLMYIYHYII